MSLFVNKITVLELFAGAGGMALGFEQAGLKTVALIENDKDACATLSKNRPKWKVLQQDVADVDFSQFEADIISGGFPCQSFSYAGKGLGFEDTRGTLFFEFARAIKEVKPKIFVGENVEGLKNHDGGRTLETMLNVLTSLGYHVQMKVLNSVDYTVAQKRKRIFLVGTIPGYHFEYPSPRTKKIVLRDALKNVPKSKGMKYSEKRHKVLEMVPPGGCWVNLPLKIQKEFMGASFTSGGGKRGMARRISWDEPCLTLTTSPSQKQTERCHPEETRPFTIREYARIQSFPDDWSFIGSVSSCYKQIGNAVPVNVARALGEEISNCINNTKESVKEERLRECVLKIVRKWSDKLFDTNTPGLTPYEKAGGFDELTRGGAKQFQNTLGKKVLEEIWDCSELYTKVEEDGEEGKGGCDGYNDTAYFESKARANTMKGSQSVEEITHKLNHAISENKEFILFVLVDLPMKKEDLIKLCEKNMINSEGTAKDLFSRLTEIDDPYRSRKIPLHKGNSMKKIEEVEGYNPQKHQWISGLEIFKYLFPDIDPESVKKIITDCISNEYQKRT